MLSSGPKPHEPFALYQEGKYSTLPTLLFLAVFSDMHHPFLQNNQ